MPLKEPKDMYQAAIKGNYALGAFNIYSIESLQAVLDAAEIQNAPVIIQVSMGTRKYVKDFSLFIKVIKIYAENYHSHIFIQHDHCKSIQACKEAIDAGVQAVMFDGSDLPWEENITKTKEMVSYAKSRNIWVEAELGKIPGFEDCIFTENVEYTAPEKAHEFIERSGCNALAISVGTSHGGVLGRNDYLPFHTELMRRIAFLTPDYPFVLHGGASLPPELIDECNRVGGKIPYWRNCKEDDIAKAIELGIRKVNMDVDNFLVTTTAIRKFLQENPHIYDPRKYLSLARDAFQKEVEHKFLHVLHSAGRCI